MLNVTAARHFHKLTRCKFNPTPALRCCCALFSRIKCKNVFRLHKVNDHPVWYSISAGRLCLLPACTLRLSKRTTHTLIDFPVANVPLHEVLRHFSALLRCTSAFGLKWSLLTWIRPLFPKIIMTQTKLNNRSFLDGKGRFRLLNTRSTLLNALHERACCPYIIKNRNNTDTRRHFFSWLAVLERLN